MREILGVIGCAHQADKSTCPYCKADLLTRIVDMLMKYKGEMVEETGFSVPVRHTRMCVVDEIIDLLHDRFGKEPHD